MGSTLRKAYTMLKYVPTSKRFKTPPLNIINFQSYGESSLSESLEIFIFK